MQLIQVKLNTFCPKLFTFLMTQLFTCHEKQRMQKKDDGVLKKVLHLQKHHL